MGNDNKIHRDITDSFKFWDFFALTQGGRIRRVSLPDATYPMVLYMTMCREDDAGVSEEALDALACREADRKNCGYAEAWMTMALGFDYLLGDRFAEMFAEAEAAKRISRAFAEEQERRKRLWRETNNEWSEDLPPALD